jgi:hypothetical protein
VRSYRFHPETPSPLTREGRGRGRRISGFPDGD